MVKRKQMKVETTVGGAISDCFSQLEELAGEMREAYDNTPESLQQSGVGEQRGEAADALEGISEPNVPERFADLPVVFSVLEHGRKYQSRAARRDDAIRYAQEAIEVLNALEEGEEGTEQDDDAEREALIDEVQQMIDDAEGVEFPGMYG